MTNAKLLRKIMGDKGYTKVGFAREIGLSRQGFENKLNGTRQFKQSEIAAISKVLKLTKKQETDIFFTPDVDSKSQ